MACIGYSRVSSLDQDVDGQVARVIAVTETASAKHIRKDTAAATLELSAAEIKTIDDAFPPPRAG